MSLTYDCCGKRILEREELSELHYITPIVNVPSMYRHGILSHNGAQKIEHRSVAMQKIQDRRAKVVVPSGKRLHDYVNLYVHARNPMMYVVRNEHRGLCVLRLTTDLLDLPGVIVTDGNASGDYVRFAQAPGGLEIVDKELVLASSWTDPDLIMYYRRKSARCAEVLVPERVDQRFIQGSYVSCVESREIMIAALVDVQARIHAVVKGDLCFQ